MSAIRVDVTLPVLRLGFGPFVVDPLEQLVGARVSDLLEPLMRGPQTQRRTGAGVLVDVYPLALPDGEGAAIPLGNFGELGFFNEHSVLLLTVPALALPFVVPRLDHALLGTPEPALAADGRSRVVNLRVKLEAGAKAAFPLGRFGEIGVEAA